MRTLCISVSARVQTWLYTHHAVSQMQGMPLQISQMHLACRSLNRLAGLLLGSCAHLVIYTPMGPGGINQYVCRGRYATELHVGRQSA